jgi:hypothetical protein
MLRKKDIRMAHRNQNVSLKTSYIYIMLSAIFLGFAGPAYAKETLPTLASFINSVRDGNASTLRGVYVKGVMAYPIVQQPSGYAGYVSPDSQVVTQFNMAAEVGNVGLLAHNYLAGTSFTQLANGQEVSLVYGDGHVETFVITQILRYQALDPYSTSSDFRNLKTGISISATELFRQVYRGDRHVTFQTCIEANGNSSWGRLFIIATPKSLSAFASH